MLFFKGLNKSPARAVIGALDFRREETAGNFIIAQVILHALAALALARAGLVGAGTGLHILFDITFHYDPPVLNIKLQSSNAK